MENEPMVEEVSPDEEMSKSFIPASEVVKYLSQLSAVIEELTTGLQNSIESLKEMCDGPPSSKKEGDNNDGDQD